MVRCLAVNLFRKRTLFGHEIINNINIRFHLRPFSIFVFANLKRNIRTYFQKDSEKYPNCEYTYKVKRDVNSFLEGPCAFAFENSSATICSMLRTTSEYWNPNDPMVEERWCEENL